MWWKKKKRKRDKRETRSEESAHAKVEGAGLEEKGDGGDGDDDSVNDASKDSVNSPSKDSVDAIPFQLCAPLYEELEKDGRRRGALLTMMQLSPNIGNDRLIDESSFNFPKLESIVTGQSSSFLVLLCFACIW